MGKVTLIAAVLTGLFSLAGIYLTHYLEGQKEKSNVENNSVKKEEATKPDSKKSAVEKPSTQNKEKISDLKQSADNQSSIPTKPTQNAEAPQVALRSDEKPSISTTSACRYYIYSDERANVKYFMSENKNSPMKGLLEHGTEVEVVDSYNQVGGVTMFRFTLGSITGWIPESKIKKRCQ